MDKKEEQEQKRIIYGDVFGTDNGQKVLEDLEHRYFINRGTAIKKSNSGFDNSLDPYWMIYNEAQRNVVLYIKKYLQKKSNIPSEG